MAKAPPRIGARPGLSPRERKRRLDDRRLTAAQRGYDAAWRRLRDAVIVERGLRCDQCKRIGALWMRDATPTMPVLEVDHIISVAERPDLRLEPSNLRVLCRPCHSRRTARDQGFARPGLRW
ncbi:HNH endonuclease [Pedomonas sp. V897]|uniref:HNH endonuclease n=1 Tax=Pedomonas sp. V897 TaxID=3446482 RepID=UPI003EE0BD69